MATRRRGKRRPISQSMAELVDRIGRQEWLDRPSYRFENVLSFGYNTLGGARNQVTNVLNGVWLGHPVHPPLASLASGVLGTTVALDAYQFTVGRRAHSIDAAHFAQHALALGIMANLGAAATGVTDWQHTHESDRRVGMVHGVLNLSATALYVWSWTQRRQGRHLRAAVGSGVGYAISLGSGYLGGHLVFASGIGMDQSGRRLDAATWTPVLSQDSLPDNGLHRAEVDGVGVVLCRTDAGVSAVGEFCPHLAAPMIDGWIDRGRIVCPWHGSQFDTETGDVVRGPAASPLPCYEARTRNGMIEVRGSSRGANADEVCSVDELRSGSDVCSGEEGMTA
jgi:nitrite reductase/ring-hydroxylating ferredoxin subunit/uncharacterized membrane protein